jgi:hypothetical protein
MRATPDISLNALGIGQNLYINGGLICCANGTSIVAPELAGFFAQENAYLSYIGNVCGAGGTTACAPVGPPMQYFYPAAYYGAGYVSHFPFYDMIGNYCNDNDVTAADGLDYYCDGTGWDNVTGWGSANMLQLAWAINWYLIPASGSNPTVNWSGPATNQWYNSNQTVNWTISDPQPSGGTPSTGIAGFTQGWDSIPPDSFSQPNGGTGDSFWSGPQYPNVSNGCLSLVGGDCAGGVSQGCHTAHVRGWNNMGWTSGDQTYGPICFDTVAPTITMSTNPTTSGTIWVDKSVVVTLTAADSGGSDASGIATTYYAINSTTCVPGSVSACSVYSSPFTVSTPGMSYIYYFTVDNAGNYSTDTYQWVSIDTTKPVTTASLGGTISSGSIYKTNVQVTLNATTTGGSGVANTYYELDGGSQTTYSTPFTVSALGNHTVKFWSVSVSGEVEATKTKTFTIASPTTATVTATPDPVMIGNSVTLNATVTATLSGTPTGTITFWNGATNLGTVTLSGGTATLLTSALPAGLNTLQVSYPATGNFLATNSPPFDETVNENTTTTLMTSLAPVGYGQPVTFTAQVAPAISGTPTGTVSFYSGSTLLGTASLNSNLASITTSFSGLGAYSINAVYSGDSTYLTSSSSALSESVNKGPQTITFPAIPAQPALTTYTLSATASSGLPVTFTTTTPSICSVSNGAATLLTPGYCAVEATQAGNTDYTAAPGVGRNLQVVKAPQTITFTSIASQPALTSVTLSATASSSLTVAFTSLTPSVCTVTSGSTSLLEHGTCTIEASQSGDTLYAAAPNVSESFMVSYVGQTITFPAITEQSALSTYTLSATASSGLPITFTTTTPSICSISGNVASLLTPGYCAVEATQAGNNDYSAAPTVGRNIEVAKASQSITFPSIASQSALTSVTLSATASSSLTVGFTSLTPNVCTVTSNSASMLEHGTCTIQASQAGDTVYSAAPKLSESFMVSYAEQTITFPAIAAQAAGTMVTLSATDSSGLPITFTTTTPSVCSISGNTATLVTTGYCAIEASQPGNNVYSAAPDVGRNIHVLPAS